MSMSVGKVDGEIKVAKEPKKEELRRIRESSPDRGTQRKRSSLFRLVLKEGGPGFCQFAITNACNARCNFCGFAVNKVASEERKYVARDAALESMDILHHHGIRYLVLTGGEPLLHPDLEDIVRQASGLEMRVMLVTNGSLLVEKLCADSPRLG